MCVIEFNYYSELMNLQGADGNQLFKTIRIDLTCEACEKAGLTCNHKLSLMPHWKPIHLQRKVDAILSTNTLLGMRETRGTIATGKHFILQKEWMEAFAKRKPVTITTNRVPALFTYIDPSGGGTASDYTVCTIAQYGSQTLVRTITRAIDLTHVLRESDDFQIQQLVCRLVHFTCCCKYLVSFGPVQVRMHHCQQESTIMVRQQFSTAHRMDIVEIDDIALDQHLATALVLGWEVDNLLLDAAVQPLLLDDVQYALQIVVQHGMGTGAVGWCNHTMTQLIKESLTHLNCVFLVFVCIRSWL